MNKIKQLVIASAVAFLVVIGIGGTAHAARTDMLDVSDYNNNGQSLTTQQFANLRNNYGIKAVTVKISEGQTWNASTAKANIADASQAGLYTNGYHFARYNSVVTAQAEARHAVQQAQVDGLGIGSVIVTDAESSAQSGVSKETNDQANQAFAQVVQQAGYRCDIYTMGSWVNTKMTVASGSGWIAYYPYHVTTDRYTDNHAWQFSSTMTFTGLSGRYDVSQLYDNYYTANTDKNAVISNAQTTHVATQNAAKSNKIAVDGIPGYHTYLKLQQLYGMRYQDGKISKPSATVRVIQKHLGVKQDGYFGPVTYRAMQRKLGTPVDGKVSRPSLMWKQIQRDINSGVKPF
ncbi:Lyzozyme M1 (1,4-beta-N-acetylmuramidase) [Paucilactobacillus vaccinostercus DSM 20634]|uniref:Lyzozyme M1 (1,4-beta-N-acetylmuramidase) n=1 Tax=Paucilactobacillus vaccinostercus DSM 20634 TaxID=1423813 RepID=A0A0R2A943_9LACO|nr:GH25 family lysozyme [Paucilactobacillus vaccinostercus]KRM62116.1 Lyzozyme M1 (1,4-beta-N-acetylmuramidase) [Paucilactobacillus vaccinostercus DSM 20634]